MPLFEADDITVMDDDKKCYLPNSITLFSLSGSMSSRLRKIK